MLPTLNRDALWDTADVPVTNRELYEILFILETGLRELIIDRLQRAAGPRWEAHRLPPDVYEKVRVGIRFERTSGWLGHVPHHPIYYIDFPELLKAITSRNNWQSVFEDDLHRKTLIEEAINDLAPIRNKVAHNRHCSEYDVQVGRGALLKVSQAVGKDRLLSLARKCTCAPAIPESLRNLRQAIETSALAVRKVEPIEPPLIPNDWWWFDETYLGVSVDTVLAGVSVLREYACLPRGRGKGHEIEAWVNGNEVDRVLSNAVAVIRTMLGEE